MEYCAIIKRIHRAFMEKISQTYCKLKTKSQSKIHSMSRYCVLKVLGLNERRAVFTCMSLRKKASWKLAMGRLSHFPLSIPALFNIGIFMHFCITSVVKT